MLQISFSAKAKTNESSSPTAANLDFLCYSFIFKFNNDMIGSIENVTITDYYFFLNITLLNTLHEAAINHWQLYIKNQSQ